jgi:hypothetical protein
MGLLYHPKEIVLICMVTARFETCLCSSPEESGKVEVRWYLGEDGMGNAMEAAHITSFYTSA